MAPFETPHHKGALDERTLARTHYLPTQQIPFSQHCFGVSCNLDKTNVEDVFIACRCVKQKGDLGSYGMHAQQGSRPPKKSPVMRKIGTPVMCIDHPEKQSFKSYYHHLTEAEIFSRRNESLLELMFEICTIKKSLFIQRCSDGFRATGVVWGVN